MKGHEFRSNISNAKTPKACMDIYNEYKLDRFKINEELRNLREILDKAQSNYNNCVNLLEDTVTTCNYNKKDAMSLAQNKIGSLAIEKHFK